ncbi:MAG: hypothetical protein K9G76_09450 [Bacteroidales bacterium]|nr:hypothetical protein [Bacteroidales bacterium]MCF8403775.1 hypothetical protein [Bacteroidales bacterium]
MLSFYDVDIEVIIILGIVYLFLVVSIAKIGTYKKCGGYKALLVAFFLTPVIGIIYASVSPQKSILKIVHYKCETCGLEYTTKHNYCPSCAKEGKSIRLVKKSMRTY